MATPSMRGHQSQIKLFSNGAKTGILNITRFNVDQDSSFLRSQYVGQKIPEGDQTVDGWSGSIDLEVKDNAADEMIDAIIQGQLDGIGVDEITMVLTDLFPNGTLASYAYADMQFKISKTVPPQNEKITKRLDFQASFRSKIA